MCVYDVCMYVSSSLGKEKKKALVPFPVLQCRCRLVASKRIAAAMFADKGVWMGTLIY